MRAEWTEGNLEFDFSSALLTWQPDAECLPFLSTAKPLKCVDFYVWYQDELWLIEVKDAEASPQSHAEGEIRAAFAQLKNDSVLKEHLLPKLYDAFVHLLQEGADLTCRVKFGILIGLAELSSADRNVLTDKIERIVQKIGPKFRESLYWPQPEVHNLETWNRAYPFMAVTRRG